MSRVIRVEVASDQGMSSLLVSSLERMIAIATCMWDGELLHGGNPIGLLSEDSEKSKLTQIRDLETKHGAVQGDLREQSRLNYELASRVQEHREDRDAAVKEAAKLQRQLNKLKAEQRRAKRAAKPVTIEPVSLVVKYHSL